MRYNLDGAWCGSQSLEVFKCGDLQVHLVVTEVIPGSRWWQAVRTKPLQLYCSVLSGALGKVCSSGLLVSMSVCDISYNKSWKFVGQIYLLHCHRYIPDCPETKKSVQNQIQNQQINRLCVQ